jgi:hypothetical protein
VWASSGWADAQRHDWYGLSDASARPGSGAVDPSAQE